MYYVYILASPTRVLYTGVTNGLERRLAEHRYGVGCKFTKKYNCHRLVFVELFHEIEAAILMEKKIKGWTRAKKIQLIETKNAEWRDLAELE